MLLLLGIALLTACGSRKDHWVIGLVTELQTNESGDLTALILQEGDREVGVLLSEGTLVFPEGNSSGTEEVLKADFQAALRPDIKVCAVCARREKKLTTGGGIQIAAYEASYVHIIGRMNRGAVTMQDGTPVDMVEDSGTHTYRLADGTELLRVSAPCGPENSYTGGTEGFDSLTETARKQVLAYYEQRGLLYDEQAELEKVYALCRKQDGGFLSGVVEQSVSPFAFSDRVMYFLTTVTLPTGDENGNLVFSKSFVDAFDRETGTRIDPWSLFTVPKDTVIQMLLDKGGVEDPALRAEMMAVSWDRRIALSSDGLSVQFERGTLPSQMYSTGFGFDYDDDIKGIIQDWAMPKSQDQT